MSDIESTIAKFIETKNKLEDLQKRHERYRKIIEEHMISEGVVELTQKVDSDSYQIKKTLMTIRLKWTGNRHFFQN